MLKKSENYEPLSVERNLKIKFIKTKALTYFVGAFFE